MKRLFVALAAATLLFAAGPSFAAKGKLMTIAGATCETGKSCTGNCENGWCSRYACVGGKWEKRLPACAQPFCRESCK
jgi:hypothetical protein